MEILLSLFLAAVCVIGPLVLIAYALFKLAAWLFTPAPPEVRPSASARTCPRCAGRLPPEQTGCPACGWGRKPVLADSLNELDIAGRQLNRLMQDGLIGAATFEAVRDAFDVQRRRMADAAAAAHMPPPIPSLLTPISAPPPILDNPFAAAPSAAIETPLPVIELAASAAETEIDPRQRVREAAERHERRLAEREAAAAAVPPPPPAPPARPLSQLLAAFMEDNNIRWGELVGGLLIVGCSIALVLSFWVQIAQQPLLKFGVFNGVTAGLFGIGFFIIRRWKLPMTGQGVLLIATLLVPLDMLGIAAVTQSASGTSTWGLVGEALSALLFGGLVYLTGKILVERWPAPLLVCVLGPSLAGLAIARHAHPETSLGMLYALASAPLVCYLAATGWVVLSLRRGGDQSEKSQLGEADAARLFKLLGLASFSTLLPLGLLVFRTGRMTAALADLAPLVSLAGGPALLVGLLIWRRVTDRAQVGIRTAGTAVGVCGAIMLALGVALAWPQPATLIPTAALAFVVLTALAWRMELPVLHLPAAACATLGWLVGWHVAAGDVGWRVESASLMWAAILSATSGAALTPLAAVVGIAAAALRKRRADDARCLLAASGVIAALSLILATWFGFGVPHDPHRVAWIYALYAIGALAAALRTRRAAMAWIASGLTLAALTQGLAFNLLVDSPWAQGWIAAFLAHASLATLGAILLRVCWREIAAESLVAALRQSAIGVSLLAVAIIPWFVQTTSYTATAMHCFWLAGIWFALAWMTVRNSLFAGFQSAVAAGILFAVAAGLSRQSWFLESALPWLDPRTLAAQGIALGLLSLAFLAARIFLQSMPEPASLLPDDCAAPPAQVGRGCSETMRRLLAGEWTVDRLLVYVVLADLLFLCVYAGWPGVAQELSPRMALSATDPRVVPEAARFALVELPHEQAGGMGTWLLMAVVVVLLSARLWERFEQRVVLALLLIAAAACPLVAARWEMDVSAASAWRWLSAGYLFVGSLPIWLRQSLTAHCGRLGWPEFAIRSAGLSATARSWVLAWSVVPLAAMAVYTGTAAVGRVGAPPDAQHAWPWTAALAILCMGMAAGFRFLPAAIGKQPGWTRQMASLSLILGLAPLVAMSLYVVAVALKQSPILGPEPDAFFGRVGLAVSYAVPVLATALVLVGHAARERSAGYAFAAGLVFNVGATAAYLLAIAKHGLIFDAEQWTRLTQLNAIISAVYAGLWMAAAWFGRRGEQKRALTSGGLLTTQVMLAAALNALLLAWAGFYLFAVARSDPFYAAVAGPVGWLAFAVAAAAHFAYVRGRGERIAAGPCAAALLGLAVLISCAVSTLGGDEWAALRTFLGAHIAIGGGLLALGWWLNRSSRSNADSQSIAFASTWLAFDARAVTRWTSVVGTLAALLAIRDQFQDPQHPWWATGALVLLAVLAAALACWAQARRFMYIAGGLTLLAANIWWIDHGAGYFRPQSSETFIDWLEINILALALPAILWTWLDLRFLKPLAARFRLPPFHRLAATLSLIVLTLIVAGGLAADAAGHPVYPSLVLGWLTLAAVAAAITACLWDASAKGAYAGLYLLGLTAVGMAVDNFHLPFPWLPWTGTMILAAYSIGASYLWSRRAGLRVWGRLLRMPVAEGDSLGSLSWLVPANCLLACVVVAAALALDLTLADLELRLLTGKAAVLQMLAVGMLARGRRESELRQGALVLGAVGAVAWGWAWLDPATTGTLLHRAVVVAVALAATTVFYGLGLAKLFPRLTEWSRAARRMTPALVAAAAAAVGFVLAAECWYFSQAGEVLIAAPAIAAVAAALWGLCAAALVAAIVPGRDPLGLSERARMAYVYAAEVLLALSFLHIRLTMPQLFHGLITQYWPVIALAIAFASAGLAELFRRQRRLVLAEPLERTGAFLPLLPVLGFWVAQSRVDYPLLLVGISGLYVALSITRRSFGYGVAAALAVNAALWFQLQRTDGFGLLDHPQLWLIPPALSALAASWMNRRRLSETQQAAIRYFASAVIYASSTADIFLNGVAEAPWLPVVLAGLSIAGIMAGIALRVRAFLFLGTSFLLVALAAIIWHAAVDLHQTWLVWVTGIVTGLLIIALFGTFERKRNEVLGLVEQLKQWKA